MKGKPHRQRENKINPVVKNMAVVALTRHSEPPAGPKAGCCHSEGTDQEQTMEYIPEGSLE